MIVKVCGMLEADNISAVSALGVDMIGFDFRLESPRFVRMVSSQAGILPDYSVERLEALRAKKEDRGTRNEEQPLRVGVFADDMPQNIVTRVYNYQLDYVQLNGEESRFMVENLRRTLDSDICPGIRVIKMLSVASADDLRQCADYVDVVDMFLFDVSHLSDWQVLDAYDGPVPFLLGGNICPEDADAVHAFHHPQYVGVDLDEGFELSPGVKDVEKLKRFIGTINN